MSDQPKPATGAQERAEQAALLGRADNIPASERSKRDQSKPTGEHTCENTDRELWREREGDYYADSIHVTKGGGIGINCGGLVIVKPLRAWHELAQREKVAWCPVHAPTAEEPIHKAHNCSANQQVGAVLPIVVIDKAKDALAKVGK